MSVQAFKATDELEGKIRDAFAAAATPIGSELDAFNAGAYDCYSLGDVFFSLKADPLSEAVPLEFYRIALPALHSLLAWPGTFEFYLSVFRKIWGDDVIVSFTVPTPGKLLIDLTAATIEANQAIAREIIADAYERIDLMTTEGDNLIFQTLQGIKTQREVDSLMKELRVAGIQTTTTLLVP